MAVNAQQDKVNVVNFHASCARQLNTYNVGTPPSGTDTSAFFEACVDKLIRSVDQKLVPSEQYGAVLIDEGHDFKPEWFKLVVQVIHPDTNSLLVLYDDAQSTYNGPKNPRFTFSSVGVQAQGSTTILKLNYRNTAEILSVARAFAADLLSPNDTEEDQAPPVQPMSTGRHGPKPLLVKLPTLRDEANFLATKLAEANKTGMPWNDMAIVYRRYGIGQQLVDALTRKGSPFQWQQDKKHSYSPMHDSVKLITMHSSKGLEFPLVCIPGIGAPTKEEEDLKDEARLIYVAMTRATQELVMTHGEASMLGEKMGKAVGVLDAM